MESGRLGLARRRPGRIPGHVSRSAASATPRSGRAIPAPMPFGVRLLACAGVLASCAGAASAADIRLPEGPGANLVYAKCRTCHDLQYVVDAKGLLPAQWSAVIASMHDYGLTATKQEDEALVRYLTTYLGHGPAPPATAPNPIGNAVGRRKRHLPAELRGVPRRRRPRPARRVSSARRQPRPRPRQRRISGDRRAAWSRRADRRRRFDVRFGDAAVRPSIQRRDCSGGELRARRMGKQRCGVAGDHAANRRHAALKRDDADERARVPGDACGRPVDEAQEQAG